MYVTAMTVCLPPRRTAGASLSSFQCRKNVSACFQEERHINLNNAAELHEIVSPVPFRNIRIAQTYEITLSLFGMSFYAPLLFSLKLFETVRQD